MWQFHTQADKERGTWALPAWAHLQQIHSNAAVRSWFLMQWELGTRLGNIPSHALITWMMTTRSSFSRSSASFNKAPAVCLPLARSLGEMLESTLLPLNLDNYYFTNSFFFFFFKDWARHCCFGVFCLHAVIVSTLSRGPWASCWNPAGSLPRVYSAKLQRTLFCQQGQGCA